MTQTTLDWSKPIQFRDGEPCELVETKTTKDELKVLKRSYKTLWNALKKIEKLPNARTTQEIFMIAEKAMMKAELQLYRIKP